MVLQVSLDSLQNLSMGILWLHWVRLPNSNGELRESSESPHDDDVTPLTFLVVVL